MKLLVCERLHLNYLQGRVRVNIGAYGHARGHKVDFGISLPFPLIAQFKNSDLLTGFDQ